MTYLVMETNMTDALVSGMNGRTIIILNYLIKKARSNNNYIPVKYKDIEKDLELGHTTVGYNMRFLQKIGAIEKLEPSLYKVNPEKINIQAVTTEF